MSLGKEFPSLGTQYGCFWPRLFLMKLIGFYPKRWGSSMWESKRTKIHGS